jgi:hypothetical protein
MSKKDFSLVELMKTLNVVEGIVKTKASINTAQASTSKSKRWKKKKQTKQVGKPVAKKVKDGKGTKAKQTGKCFHCNKVGH